MSTDRVFAVPAAVWAALGPNELRALQCAGGPRLPWSRRGNRVETAPLRPRCPAAQALRDLGSVVPLVEIFPEEPRCRICGCVEALACEGGCSWVAMDLCSACRGQHKPLPRVEVPRG